jgi:BirA family biotin operon repressor/biotin-[acetyl-CoA-carboxylase] ligase
VGDDLSLDALAAALPERAVRTYPALLSTEADALAWARAGAPQGAVVVADYQASPRGRGGRPWQVLPGVGLAFSLVLRPRLAPARDGWLYVIASCAIADVLGSDARLDWPDEVRVGERRVAAVGVQAELAPPGAPWAVVSVLMVEARPPRTPLLARVVEAIEARDRAPAEALLHDYLARCSTLGRAVRARLLPLGPAGGEVAGTAVTVLKDGALVVATPDARRVAVPPGVLAVLDDAEAPAAPS